jgi:hypothetical protein
VDLTAIACPSASECVAVDSTGEEVTFDPSAPGTPTPATIDAGTGLVMLACPSTSQCTAIDGNGQQVTFDPTTPGTPAPTTIDGQAGIEGLACPSAGQCTAVDHVGFEVTFNPIAPANPGRTAVDPISYTLTAVACPSTSQCTTVDNFGTEMTFNPLDPGLTPRITIEANTSFTGLACPSTTLCLVIEQVGSVVTFNPHTPNIRTFATIDSGNSLRALTCPSASECLAVDSVGRAFLGDPGDPYSWTLEPIAEPNSLTSVACGAVWQCVVLDGLGRIFVGLSTPLNASPPTISGSAIEGQTLAEAQGLWAPSPTGYSYQWQRCDPAGASCVAISGATGQTYTLTSTDVGATIQVQETASDSSGASSPAASSPTAMVTSGSSGSGGTPPPAGTSPPAARPPKVTGYRIANNPFVVAAAPTPIMATAAASTHRRGTMFSYTLSEAATVRITIFQRLSGRRRGRSCVPPTKQQRKAKMCSRILTRGTLTRASHQGANSVAFSGRIGSTPLKPGHYQATLTATDRVKQTSKAQTISFVIVTH